MSQNASSVTLASRTFEMGGQRLTAGDPIDAYIFHGKIASGGMAHVLLATDSEDRQVALKVLKSTRRGTALQRFHREFRALEKLQHPNVIRVYTHGRLFGHPYIAMEYVEGRDLHQEIRGYSRLSRSERWRKVESNLSDLGQALYYIHRRGLVHRDLKPSNVLVDREGRCKLTDFGIVKELDSSSDPFVSTALVGTWAYASPEQITGQPIDHRSDLYSLGVILFAMLTSKRPFAAKDMAGYIELHRDRSPMLPRAIDPEIPPHLEDICLRLLAKAPHDRFQSGLEILDRLERTEGPTEATVALPEAAPWRPPLVGRESQLRQIDACVSGLTRSAGGVLLIGGAEGSGRTRMLEAAIDRGRRIGMPVYSTQMSPSKGAFEPLLEVATVMSRELGARVPRELNRAMLTFARGRGRLVGDVRYQLYDGIRGAMSILLREGPLILAIDDFHLAPAPLVGLLSFLVRTLIVQDQRGLLVLVTLRTGRGEAAVRGFAEGTELGLRPVRLTLPPLSAPQVRVLMESHLGQGPRASALAVRLHHETRGNPFFVSEYLRAMIEGHDPSGRSADPEVMSGEPMVSTGDGQIPSGVRRVVGSRLAGLDSEDRALIDTMSAAGREIDLDVLLDVVIEDEDLVLDRIDRLIGAGFLVERRVGLQTLVGFVPPKVGEVVYAELSDARRVAAHRSLGAALEIRHSGNPLAAEVIGEHYRRAGREGRAYLYLVKAAVSSWERSLGGEAIRVARRAKALEEAARVALTPSEFLQSRIGLLRVRSDTLFNRGAWSEAREALTALRGAAISVGDERLAARVGLKLGGALDILGHSSEGVAMVQAVLEKARMRGDRAGIMASLHVLASFAFERGDYDTCDRLASQGLAMGQEGKQIEARAKLLLALTVAQACRGEMSAAVAGLTEAGSILRRLRMKRETVLVLCNLGEIHQLQGDAARAIQRSDEGMAIAREVMFQFAQPWGHRIRGSARLIIGDLDGAAADLTHALAESQKLVEQNDRLPIRYYLGVLELSRGNNAVAEAHFDKGLALAERGDGEAYGPPLRANLARVYALQNRVADAAQILLSLASGLDTLTVPRRTQVQLNMGTAWVEMGAREQAVPLLRVAARVAREQGFVMMALMARVVLARICPPDEARRMLAEGAELAADIAADLPPSMAAHFRSKPELASVLGSVVEG